MGFLWNIKLIFNVGYCLWLYAYFYSFCPHATFILYGQCIGGLGDIASHNITRHNAVFIQRLNKFVSKHDWWTKCPFGTMCCIWLVEEVLVAFWIKQICILFHEHGTILHLLFSSPINLQCQHRSFMIALHNLQLDIWVWVAKECVLYDDCFKIVNGYNSYVLA